MEYKESVFTLSSDGVYIDTNDIHTYLASTIPANCCYFCVKTNAPHIYLLHADPTVPVAAVPPSIPFKDTAHVFCPNAARIYVPIQ